MLDKILRNSMPEPNSGCLIWLGAVSDGYGMIRIGGRVERVHRVAYRDTKGPIPAGMCVLHHCDNPPCCNPEHLFLGTKLDNAIDRDKKHRCDRSGVRNGRVKLKIEQVLMIRNEPGLHRNIARKYGVTPDLIGKIKRRELWGHLNAG
jgi:hypothetical protein